MQQQFELAVADFEIHRIHAGGVDFGQCVKQADLALYETKRFNKGTFNVYNYDRS